MLESLFLSLKNVFAHNQLMSGGLVLMLVGSVVALARRLPARLWGVVTTRFTTAVTVTSDDPLYHWIEHWFHERIDMKRIGHYDAGTKLNRSNNGSLSARPGDDEERPKLIFSPSVGQHWVSGTKGKFIGVHKVRSERGDGHASRDSIAIRVFGRDRDTVRRICEEARDLAIPIRSISVLTIYTPSYMSWQVNGQRTTRAEDTVILADGVFEDVRDDIVWFVNNRDWYAKRSIPYRRGYMFYGGPGNGKTTLAIAAPRHCSNTTSVPCHSLANALQTTDSMRCSPTDHSGASSCSTTSTVGSSNWAVLARRRIRRGVMK